MGYHHIQKEYAVRINQFYQRYFMPYLNFHRPCAFPKEILFPNGKRKTIYPYEDYKTPYQKFLSLLKADQYLREDITLAKLEATATKKTPNDAAREMQEAKRKMMTIIISSHRSKTR